MLLLIEGLGAKLGEEMGAIDGPQTFPKRNNPERKNPERKNPERKNPNSGTFTT
jgi:hypothetical protein